MKKLDDLGRDELFYKIVDKEFEDALNLIDRADNINFQDKNGFSYLHVAIQARSVEITKKLLDKGAEIEIKDRFGKTPLMLAISVYNGDDKIIKILIESGADKENKADSGVSCMKLAEMKGIVI